MEDRYNEIERENRILLTKMTNIMQSGKNDEKPFEKRSLNRDYRKRELLKITMEN